MFGSQFEYLFVLSLAALITVTMFWETILGLLRQRHFWITVGVLILFVIATDLVALKYEWWGFSPDKNIGFTILGIPCEEILLGFFFSTFSIAVWESIGHDME